MYGIYANIGGILMVNVTIYSIHGSYGYLHVVHKPFIHCFMGFISFKNCRWYAGSIDPSIPSDGSAQDGAPKIAFSCPTMWLYGRYNELVNRGFIDL